MRGRMSLIDRLIPASFAIALVLLWQFVPPLLGIPSYIWPTISQIIDSIFGGGDVVAYNTYVTVIEAISGCFIGCAMGLLIGVAMSEVRMIGRILLPYVVSSNAIPIVAIAPLIVLWLGQGILSRSIVAGFLSFFPITINVYQGLASYRIIYQELFTVLGATRWQFFFKFKILNALPFLFSGLKVSATLAVIGAVVAEFVAPESGLGFGMLQATYNLDTPRLFGYLFISCFIGVTMYGVGAAAEYAWDKMLGTSISS